VTRISLTLSFTILTGTLLMASSNPVPFANQPLVPAGAKPGSRGFILKVNGTGFVAGASVQWNGSPRPTKLVSSSQLQATIRAKDVAKPGTVAVLVLNPNPGGGSSNPVYFTIRDESQTVHLVHDKHGFEKGSLVVADFNGDGKLDVAISRNSCPQEDCAIAIDVFLGKGDGTFGPRIRTLLGGKGVLGDGNLVVADFNADGNPDVSIEFADSCGCEPAVGKILLGNGDGTFTPTAYGTYQGYLTAVGDLNSDGLPDLITIWSTVYTNPATVIYLANNDTSYTMGQFFDGMGMYQAALGDFNQDGTLDLAINGCPSAVCDHYDTMVALGNGDGTFQTPIDYGYPGTEIQAIDVNGDGKLDLVTDSICTLLGNGDGTFVQAGCTTGGSSGYASMVMGDFNGDGMPDVALLDQPYGQVATVAVYPGRGNGTFGNAINYALPDLNGFYGGLRFGDFNGDGRLDFAVDGSWSFPITSSAVLLQTSR
jgi:hypothetical protein